MMFIIEDLRYIIRAFVMKPWLSIAIVIMIALGTGANSAIFSLVNSAILRPIAYAEPENLVIIWETYLKRGWRNMNASLPNYEDWRNNSQSFEGVGAFYQRSMVIESGGEPLQAWASITSPELFSVLRVQPMIGRNFIPKDNEPGAGPVVILGYNLWMQLFNGDHNMLDKSITLNERKYMVVGVMPPGFEFPPRFRQGDYQVPKVELWVSMKTSASDPETRSSHYLFVIGRLKQGVTLSRAQAEMSTIAKNIEKQYPKTNDGWGVRVTSLQYHYGSDIRLMLLTLLGAVSFLLLIACANIASLRLSQLLSRQNELAIRSSLGCSRGGILRLLLMESILLSLIGGAVGVAIAYGFLKVLTVAGAADPRLLSSRLDSWSITYTFIVAMITAIMFGLLPALRASNVNLVALLRVDGQTASWSGTRSHLSKALVVTEIALSFVLLIGAGLTLRSLINIQHVNTGYERKNILTAQILLPSSSYNGIERPTQFFKLLLQRVNALPGVESASMASDTPLDNEAFILSFNIEGIVKKPEDVTSASVRMVAPRYFHTMGIRLVDGRDFGDGDVDKAPGVVIINEALARRFWTGESPLGKKISIDFPTEHRRHGQALKREIVGVVANTRDDRLEAEGSPGLFVPHAQRPWTRMTLVIRSPLPTASIAPSLRNEVRRLDEHISVYNIKTLEQWVIEAIGRHRFAAFLLNSFAVLALITATLGIYSIVSNSISSRSKEFGIRMALGATPRSIIQLVLKQVVGLVLAGMSIGLGAAILLTRFLSGMLYEISPLNISTYAAISTILVLIATLAAYLPAKRITNINPYLTLHS